MILPLSNRRQPYTLTNSDFVKKSFTPGKSNSPLVTSPFSWSASHCKRTAAVAAAAVVVAVVAVGKWKTTCKVLLSVLSVFPCSRFSLSPPATFPVSRTSCAALVAARHTLRRPRAVRKCGPLSIRTHQASLPPCHVSIPHMAFSSCIEFASSFFVLHGHFSSPSCPSWAFSSLSYSFLGLCNSLFLFFAPPEHFTPFSRSS